ncbi:hypothetical protein EMIT0P265_190028 [Pseudomonas zeae]
MCERDVSYAELARRMGCARAESIRFVSFFHPAKICTIELALNFWGIVLF